MSIETKPANRKNKTTRCVIVSGAPSCVPFLPQETDYVIACDHGYDHTRSLGIRPDLLLGDFDSCVSPLDPSIPLLTVPAEKDDTDTMLAIRHGLSLGYRDFLLLGATGGRADHFLANCSACAFLAKQGAFCEMRDETYTLYAMSHGTLTLAKQEGAFLSFPSVIPLMVSHWKGSNTLLKMPH